MGITSSQRGKQIVSMLSEYSLETPKTATFGSLAINEEKTVFFTTTLLKNNSGRVLVKSAKRNQNPTSMERTLCYVFDEMPKTWCIMSY